MKNSVKYIITAVVAIVLIVAASIFIKSSNKRFSDTLQSLSGAVSTQANVLPDAPAATTAPATAAAQPSATVASTEATVSGAQPSATQPAATQAAASASTDAEKIKLVNDAVSALRHTQNFSAVKDQTIAIKLTDCSMPALTSAINGVIEKMGGTKSLTFAFVNGSATDPESNQPITPMAAIPPTDKEFTLEEAGIASVTSAADGTNTVYTFKLKPETSSLTTLPKYHAQTMDILDLASIDLPITVTEANFNYLGATIDVTVDAQGRVVKFHENMPIDGTGGGKLGLLSANAEIEGYLDEVWTITW